MKWNWQKPAWPRFQWEQRAPSEREERFLREAGVVVGALKHVGEDQRSNLVIELISTEALKTSEIEGEIRITIAQVAPDGIARHPNFPRNRAQTFASFGQ